jgi:hypothetical protein
MAMSSVVGLYPARSSSLAPSALLKVMISAIVAPA